MFFTILNNRYPEKKIVCSKPTFWKGAIRSIETCDNIIYFGFSKNAEILAFRVNLVTFVVFFKWHFHANSYLDR